jgi:hypothetical protein
VSIYINGCGQRAHVDSEDCSLSFILSLTRWDKREFSGGETFLDYALLSSLGIDCSSYPDSIAQLYGRLTILDGRVQHGVRKISGTNNPLLGRIVVHGMLQFCTFVVHNAGNTITSIAQPSCVLALQSKLCGKGAHGTLVLCAQKDYAGQRKIKTIFNQVICPRTNEYGAVNFERDASTFALDTPLFVDGCDKIIFPLFITP